MAQAQIPSSLTRILKICLILIGIGTFAVVVIGTALTKSHTENKETVKYLEIAKDVQPNFETSLLLYTEKTQDIIAHLLKLRPENEGQYVNFISNVEKIAQNLSLNANIQSYKDVPAQDKRAKTEKTSGSETINYQISFFGSISQLNSFLSKLEALPYFVKIDGIEFKDPNYIEKTEQTPPNAVIKMNLYIKNPA